MKLRKRNLGPILDANGWAVNARARINVPFGTSLTGIAKLPPGSSVDVTDKYAEKSAAWPKVLVTVFIIWWIYAFLNDDQGRLYRWTGGDYGKPPAEVQKLIDQQQADELKAAEERAAAEKAATEVVTPPPAPAPVPAPVLTPQPPVS
jgi:hypothetical protein